MNAFNDSETELPTVKVEFMKAAIESILVRASKGFSLSEFKYLQWKEKNSETTSRIFSIKIEARRIVHNKSEIYVFHEAMEFLRCSRDVHEWNIEKDRVDYWSDRD